MATSNAIIWTGSVDHKLALLRYEHSPGVIRCHFCHHYQVHDWHARQFRIDNENVGHRCWTMNTDIHWNHLPHRNESYHVLLWAWRSVAHSLVAAGISKAMWWSIWPTRYHSFSLSPACVQSLSFIFSRHSNIHFRSICSFPVLSCSWSPLLCLFSPLQHNPFSTFHRPVLSSALLRQSHQVAAPLTRQYDA